MRGLRDRNLDELGIPKVDGSVARVGWVVDAQVDFLGIFYCVSAADCVGALGCIVLFW